MRRTPPTPFIKQEKKKTKITKTKRKFILYTVVSDQKKNNKKSKRQNM